MGDKAINSVEQYLESLPEERSEALRALRAKVVALLPPGFEEVYAWGMICYQVPKTRYPKTYNNQPLMLAGIASQKNHMAIYLVGLYMIPEMRTQFEQRWRATGKRFDAGKSCVRFRRLDDLVMPLIEEVVSTITVDGLIAAYEKGREKG